MTTQEALKKLKEYENLSFAINHAAGVLYYDGATAAPRGSAVVRGKTMSELSRIVYELTTDPETVEALETLNGNRGQLDMITRRKVDELYRDYDRTRRIPIDEFVEYEKLRSDSDAVWHKAKEDDDYAAFEPYLQRMFDMTKRIALYMEPDKPPYDAMLDMFERGLTTEKCDEFFSALKLNLTPLVARVSMKGYAVDDSPLRQKFSIDKQREFSDYVMSIMGIDRNHCIIGETEHPFTTDFSKYDVRITTHYYEDMPLSSMYSVIHEGGHALYELHTGDELQFSCLGGGASMAIHESQSRFYENIIGRSREFCSLIFPWLREKFSPQLDDIDAEELYRIANKSEPSLIRTEADELTYSLHIMIRYELEKKMFSGEITAKELPNEWNRLYKEYLGVNVPTDREGVLQDSHWSNGNIGYFPSYAIGSAYGAQYLYEMNKDFDVYGAVSDGNIEKINGWFEEKIWRRGKTIDPSELFESVCRKFNPKYYIDYLEKKYTDAYGL